MLAHTTSRYIIIGSQLAVGIILLSASYFSEDGFNTTAQLKASVQQSPAATELTQKEKHC